MSLPPPQINCGPQWAVMKMKCDANAMQFCKITTKQKLMLLSIEGFAIPDVRDATTDDEAAFSKLIDKAYTYG